MTVRSFTLEIPWIGHHHSIFFSTYSPARQVHSQLEMRIIFLFDSIGRSIWTKLIRNKTAIQYLSNAEAYNFNYQYENRLPKPIKLYPVTSSFKKKRILSCYCHRAMSLPLDACIIPWTKMKSHWYFFKWTSFIYVKYFFSRVATEQETKCAFKLWHIILEWKIFPCV